MLPHHLLLLLFFPVSPTGTASRRVLITAVSHRDMIIAVSVSAGVVVVIMAAVLGWALYRLYLTRQQPQAPPASPAVELYARSRYGDDPHLFSVQCTVCHVDFVEGDDIRFLPCAHRFHSQCLIGWMRGNGETCPRCQRRFNPDQWNTGRPPPPPQQPSIAQQDWTLYPTSSNANGSPLSPSEMIPPML